MAARLIMALLALFAAGLVALALVWPQGEGRPSPAPFGHSPESTRAPANTVVR